MLSKPTTGFQILSTKIIHSRNENKYAFQNQFGI